MAVSPCATLISYELNPCSIPAGGISDIFIFDPTVFSFTQASATSTQPIPPYTAIVDLGTSDLIYPVKFEPMSPEYDFDLDNPDGVAPGFTHKLMFSVPKVALIAANWSSLVNLSSYCCGLGVIIITNSGDILVMGERMVNSLTLSPKFYVWQDKTKGGTGKKGNDKNTVTITLTSCAYYRMLVPYTGTDASIYALAAA